MWCCSGMKISWTDRVRNVKVLHTCRVKEKRNILHRIQRRTANWIGHTVCRNCLTEHVTEGKTEGRVGVTGRRGGRRKQILGDPMEKKKILLVERGSSRSRCVEMSIWKRLWTSLRLQNGLFLPQFISCSYPLLSLSSIPSHN
jgi:hypothetical protein